MWSAKAPKAVPPVPFPDTDTRQSKTSLTLCPSHCACPRSGGLSFAWCSVSNEIACHFELTVEKSEGSMRTQDPKERPLASADVLSGLNDESPAPAPSGAKQKASSDAPAWISPSVILSTIRTLEALVIALVGFDIWANLHFRRRACRRNPVQCSHPDCVWAGSNRASGLRSLYGSRPAARGRAIGARCAGLEHRVCGDDRGRLPDQGRRCLFPRLVARLVRLWADGLAVLPVSGLQLCAQMEQGRPP